MDLNLCLDAVPSFLNFFDLSIAPVLLFYAYIPIFVLSVFFGLFILRRDHNSVLSKYFLGITLSFAIWILLILFMWIGAYLETVHLAWQLLLLPEISVFLFSVLFVYVFLFKRDVSAPYKYFSALLLVVVAILLPTRFNIDSFDLTNCEGVVGVIWPLVYVFELVFLIVIILIAIKKLLIKEGPEEKIKTVLFSVGMILFLGIFWASNYFGELTQTYEINLVGPIGMVLFLGVLSYMIVRFKTFNTKLFTSQILVVVLGFLIGALLFIQNIDYIHIVIWVTLGLVVIVGFQLVKSVKREIEQREKIEKLAGELEIANQQKSEFMSFASHELKSPLTAIKGYASMILEGNFGNMNPPVKDATEKILVKANDVVILIAQYLDKSKIELGQLKYDFSSVDMATLVVGTVKEFQPSATQKGLQLLFSSAPGCDYTVSADSGKMKEVIGNLIDNSIKYTPSGSVNVSISRQGDKVLIKISDTGVGISPEILPLLFKKFSRATDASKQNILGTGLGLYLTHEFITAHKGRVWVESAGEGHGSQFFVELPVG